MWNGNPDRGGTIQSVKFDVEKILEEVHDWHIMEPDGSLMRLTKHEKGCLMKQGEGCCDCFLEGTEDIGNKGCCIVM